MAAGWSPFGVKSLRRTKREAMLDSDLDERVEHAAALSACTAPPGFDTLSRGHQSLLHVGAVGDGCDKYSLTPERIISSVIASPTTAPPKHRDARRLVWFLKRDCPLDLSLSKIAYALERTAN